jgi:hypothetical protein
VATHAVQIAECPRLPGVSGQWWTHEDVKEPGYQGASNSEDQNGVEKAFEPLNNGARSEKEKYD